MLRTVFLSSRLANKSSFFSSGILHFENMLKLLICLVFVMKEQVLYFVQMPTHLDQQQHLQNSASLPSWFENPF